jgi:sulfatase modifying factor 1
VTQGQYQAVMNENPAAETNCKIGGVGTRLPMHCVTFYDAVKYANALSGVEGREKCYVISGEKVSWPKKHGCTGYRLPTEAEWEYAAKAGKAHRYAGGNEPGEYAWYDDNSDYRVHAVKTRKPNGWGLYDMSGNVWEWTWDVYTSNLESLPRTDPVGGGDRAYRVFRGGSWGNVARYARAANRMPTVPGSYNADRGFRLARSYP